MNTDTSPSRLKVYLAFAAIYLIWGSTYFFIREALDGFPPFMLGGLRFISASVLMLGWCAVTGVDVRPKGDLKNAAIVGVLLLLVGNGVVVWTEQTIPSSVVAIMIASAPLWFVLLDRPNWGINFRSPSTMLGVLAGFCGVLVLFGKEIAEQFSSAGLSPEIAALGLLVICEIGWTSGSLFAKAHPPTVPAPVNTAWQMMSGGICFMVVSVPRGEWSLDWSLIPAHAVFALIYLSIIGSILAFSAYVWLLKVRPAVQVSTYAYVNPVVAVMMGVFLGNEHIGWRELTGLIIILGGVLLINLAKYRASR
ncbi:MAG: EamA family transporter [Flavobacteriales bacterium]